MWFLTGLLFQITRYSLSSGNLMSSQLKTLVTNTDKSLSPHFIKTTTKLRVNNTPAGDGQVASVWWNTFASPICELNWTHLLCCFEIGQSNRIIYLNRVLVYHSKRCGGFFFKHYVVVILRALTLGDFFQTYKFATLPLLL